MATQPTTTYPPYNPNYAMYSRAPQGWHDEPFEYVFSFQNALAANTPAASTSFYNQPLQFDPDADFFMRGMAAMQDTIPYSGAGLKQILFALRMRNAFGRALDSGFIPIGAYCGHPNFSGFPTLTDPWQATPWYPEQYFPANSAMWVDFEALNNGGYYSIHLYFQGVKRFQNESCKPGAAASTAKAAQ